MNYPFFTLGSSTYTMYCGPTSRVIVGDYDFALSIQTIDVGLPHKEPGPDERSIPAAEFRKAWHRVSKRITCRVNGKSDAHLKLTA